MLTIFSKPNCPNCEAAKRFLSNLDIHYTTKDITTDKPAREFVIQAGHRAVPQFYNEEQLLCGWNELMALTKDQINKMIGDSNVTEHVNQF